MAEDEFIGVGLRAPRGVSSEQMRFFCDKLNEAIATLTTPVAMQLCGDLVMGMMKQLGVPRPEVEAMLAALVSAHYGPVPRETQRRHRAAPTRVRHR
jgi:hypothetical protein